MHFHCDVTYNHKGQYVDHMNEQVENTPSVIITLGDDRDLKWQKQICMVNQKTGRLKWYDMDKSEFCKTVVLGDKTIFIVNTLDERPILDSNYGCLIRYQHGNDNVTKSKISCGLVLRVVKNICPYDNNNHLITDSKKCSSGNVPSIDPIKHEGFLKEIQSIFKNKFKTYRN